MPWVKKTDGNGDLVRVWIDDEPKPPVSFLVEFRRRIGFVVPDWSNPVTPYVEMLVSGRRYLRKAPVHHTPRLNLNTGKPHTGEQERQRRIRQQERAGRK